MVDIELICFTMVCVGSLGIFYYLGFLHGEEFTKRTFLEWGLLDEEEPDE